MPEPDKEKARGTTRSEKSPDYTLPTVGVLPDPHPDATGVMVNGHWFTRADVYAHNVLAHRRIAHRDSIHTQRLVDAGVPPSVGTTRVDCSSPSASTTGGV